MTKKKTPVKKRGLITPLDDFAEVIAAFDLKISLLAESVSLFIKDQTRLIEILLARCDAQDKAIGKIEVHNHKMDQEFDTLSTVSVKASQRADKQDLQLDRLIKINWLMMRELQRFCKTQLEPATVASIRADLKTPTLAAGAGDPLDPAFNNRNHTV